MNSKTKKNKLISAGLSVLVVLILLLAGPASAVKLELNIDNPNVYVGEDVVLDFYIDTEHNTYMFTDFTFEFNDYSCVFSANGENLSTCDGVKVEILKPTSGYGYGYDYGYSFGYGTFLYGKIKYKIILDSSMYPAGEYISRISIGTDKSEDVIFNILNRPVSSHISGGGGCYTEWSCSEWSSCSLDSSGNLTSVRTCEKIKNQCRTRDEKPSEKVSCFILPKDDLIYFSNETAIFSNTSSNYTAEIEEKSLGISNLTIFLVVLFIIAFLLWLWAYLTSSKENTEFQT